MTEGQTRTPIPAPPTGKRSRTISNLTEKQIRQKREVDRKAQRAFRQRAKDCLANLEQQHRELQQTSRDTEARLRHELEVLGEQNQQLLRCLVDIVEAVSALKNEASDPAVVSNRDSIASPLSLIEPQATISRGSVSRRCSPYEIERSDASRPVHDAARSPSSQDAAPDLGEVAMLDPEHEPINMGIQERTPTSSCHQQYFGNSLHRLVRPGSASPSQAVDLYTLPHAEALNNVHLEIGHDDGQDHDGSQLHSLKSHHTLLAATTTGQVSSAYYEVGSSTSGHAQAFKSASYESAQFGDSSTVGADVPSLQLLPTCHLDQIMLDFIYGQRNMLSQGIPLASVVGPEKPTVKALVDPGFCAPVHAISNVLSKILSTLLNVRQTEKLALFYVMYKSMRVSCST